MSDLGELEKIIKRKIKERIESGSFENEDKLSEYRKTLEKNIEDYGVKSFVGLGIDKNDIIFVFSGNSMKKVEVVGLVAMLYNMIIREDQ